ncbi:MAG: hypothetical protein HC872_01725 [Gammaproteobacteria bacterium]|nr:hypothetical protein [Gammaproteobacteria bacterium]
MRLLRRAWPLVAAILVLGLMGIAIAGGLLSGTFFGEKFSDLGLRVWIPLAAAGVSASIFITMAEEVVEALHCVYRQLFAPQLSSAAKPAARVFASLCALGFSIATAEEPIKALILQADVRPFLLKTEVDAPVAIFPILFDRNAELSEKYKGETLPPSIIEGDENIWQAGVDLSGRQKKDIGKFVAALAHCWKLANEDEPLVIRVQGFASSREFGWKTQEGARRHPQSDELNMRAARDRASAVIGEIVALPEYDRNLINFRRQPLYRSLAALIDQRLTVDTLDRELDSQREDLARRAEIVVLYAPQCSAAKLSGVLDRDSGA